MIEQNNIPLVRKDKFSREYLFINSLGHSLGIELSKGVYYNNQFVYNITIVGLDKEDEEYKTILTNAEQKMNSFGRIAVKAFGGSSEDFCGPQTIVIDTKDILEIENN